MPTEMGMWREQLTETTSATTHTCYSETVPDGSRWYLERVTVRNADRQNSDCLVSIDNPAHDHPLYYFANMGDNVAESKRIPCWLVEGERLKFAFADVQSGDTLHIHITGQKRYRERK